MKNNSAIDNQFKKIRWDKVDKNVYSSVVKEDLKRHGISSENKENSVESVESTSLNVCNVLREAALKCITKRKPNNPKH